MFVLLAGSLIGRRALTGYSYKYWLARLTPRFVQPGKSRGMQQKSHTAPANTPDQPAAGKGMPAAPPPAAQTQQPQPGRPTSQKNRSDEAQLELPRDRDEATDMTGQRPPDPMIEQAAIDVAQGRQDTSQALETNRAYTKLKKDAGGLADK